MVSSDYEIGLQLEKTKESVLQVAEKRIRTKWNKPELSFCDES